MFVIIYSTGSKGEGFSEHSISSCQKLCEILQSTESDIASGNVTINQFQRIENKWDNHIHPIMTTMKMNDGSFKDVLTKMRTHVCLFNFYQALLKIFISHLDTKGFEGMLNS